MVTGRADIAPRLPRVSERTDNVTFRMFRDLRKNPSDSSGRGQDEEFTCFFLHHAGGSAVSFLPMQRWFPADWRLRAVELPGRGMLADQPPCRSTAEAVAALAPAFLAEVRGPFAIFGHSMGALVGYELARELQRCGSPPHWLGLSAMLPPRQVSVRFSERRDLWSRERLVRFLRDLGGTTDEMLENTDMVDYMVEILRTDLRIVDTYAYVDGPPLTVPLSVFSGEQDPLANPECNGDWNDHCARPVTFHALPGGHFYLFEQAERFAQCVTADVERARGVTLR